MSTIMSTMAIMSTIIICKNPYRQRSLQRKHGCGLGVAGLVQPGIFPNQILCARHSAFTISTGKGRGHQQRWRANVRRMYGECAANVRRRAVDTAAPSWETKTTMSSAPCAAARASVAYGRAHAARRHRGHQGDARHSRSWRFHDFECHSRCWRFHDSSSAVQCETKFQSMRVALGEELKR